MAATGEKKFMVCAQQLPKTSEENLLAPAERVFTAIPAEWIMNFITVTDAMLNKDPKAQAQLENMPGKNAEPEPGWWWCRYGHSMNSWEETMVLNKLYNNQ